MTPTAILKLAVDVLHVPCFLRVYDDEGMTLVEIADVHGRDTGVSAKADSWDEALELLQVRLRKRVLKPATPQTPEQTIALLRGSLR